MAKFTTYQLAFNRCIDAVHVREVEVPDAELAEATTDAARLELKPEPVYDRVVMNPPFDRGRDVDHVLHAWEFLAPGGTLVAVMSSSTEFREDRKTRHLRSLMAEHRAEWRDLPLGSFAEAGTNVSSLYVKATKKG